MDFPDQLCLKKKRNSWRSLNITTTRMRLNYLSSQILSAIVKKPVSRFDWLLKEVWTFLVLHRMLQTRKFCNKAGYTAVICVPLGMSLLASSLIALPSLPPPITLPSPSSHHPFIGGSTWREAWGTAQAQGLFLHRFL